jgi:hypothetical protein
MRTALLLLLVVGRLKAQPTEMRVVGVPLPTQVVISYSAPSAAVCTIEVSHERGYNPVVNDVNPGLFPLADIDLMRPSTIVDGLHRTIIVGSETSDVAGDVFYSRALFAEREHFVRIRCDGNSASLSFITPAPPVGDLFAKVPPFNPAAWGNHAWPTIDPTNQRAEYADPMTGATLRLFTKTGEYVRQDLATVQFGAYTGGAGWNNPRNILAHSASTVAQTANTNPIVVYPDPRTSNGMMQQSWKGTHQVDDLGLYAFVGASGTGPDAQFAVCRTLDGGKSCFGKEIISTAASGSVAAFNGTGKVTQNYPKPFFSDWGGRGVPMEHFPVHGYAYENGAAITVVSGVAKLNNGSANAAFPTTLSPGSKIWIADSSEVCPLNLCTVETWDSPTQVTLTETALSVSNKEFYTLAVGIRIRKINSNGTLSISVGYRSHGSTGFTNAAAPHRYNLNSFTSRDGKVGRLCVIQNTLGAPIMMFCADDGTTRLISIGRRSFSTAEDAPLTIIETHMSGFTTFHPTDPKVFFVITKTNRGYPNSNYALFRVTYTGDSAISHVTNCGPLGDCTFVEDNTRWENLTPASTGNHLQAKAEVACGPEYTRNKALYGSFDNGLVAPGSGKYGILYLPYSGQDGGPAWYLIIDTSSNPVTIAKCLHTLSETSINRGGGIRWGAHHSVAGIDYPAGTMLFSTNALQHSNTNRVHSGPFQFIPSHVLRNGEPSGDTSLPWPENSTYDRECPTDIPQFLIDSGATGNKCVTMRGPQPCNLSASAAERAAFPCPWNARGSQPLLLAIGDSIVNGGLAVPFASEHLTLLKLTELENGVYEYVFYRDSSLDICSARHGENNASRNTHANGWTAFVAVTGRYSCDGGYMLYQPETGVFAEIGKYIGTAHNHLGRAVGSTDPTRVSFVTTNPGSVLNTTLAGLTAYPPTIVQYRLTGFGATGSPGFNIQSYMKRSAYLRDDVEWAIDSGAINPNQGGGVEDGISTIGSRAITLQGGTKQVYKIGIIGNLRNIKYAPLHGWAGRYLLQEKSGPETGDTLTDADSYKFCYAYTAGECRSGSLQHDIYVSIPNADTGTAALVGQSFKNSPVVISGFSIANWSFRRGMEQETNGDGIQRLTMALSTAAGHYSYMQTITDPNGTWALNSASGWRQGEHVHALLTKLPAYERDSVDRSTYQQITIDVPKLEGATHARIMFGRNQSYECMARAEACVTDSTLQPWAFVESDAPAAPTMCDSGCTINMPATTGVWYYRIEWLNSSGTVVEKGSMAVRPVL